MSPRFKKSSLGVLIASVVVSAPVAQAGAGVSARDVPRQARATSIVGLHDMSVPSGASAFPWPRRLRLQPTLRGGAAHTVNLAGDESDQVTTDAVCDVDTTTSALDCTLRAALEQANADAGTDTIGFAVGSGPVTIAPGRALPTVDDSVVIDGTTQPGYGGTPIVELSGAGAGLRSDGLRITAGGSTVRGLVINRFGVGLALSTNGGNAIEGNYIGTDVTGTLDRGNGPAGASPADPIGSGIILLHSPGNRIGGSGPADRNVVSGNDGDGVLVYGSGATGNVIEGNSIGTTAHGSGDLGNAENGVLLTSVAPSGGASANTTVERNVVSGNGERGVQVFEAPGNTIVGNLVGTRASGSGALGNSDDGVLIAKSLNNTVGGPLASERNVISGNHGPGITIVGASSSGNAVRGNYIGTDAAGTGRLGNDGFGVSVGSGTDGGAVNNVIGGDSPGYGNVISDNLRGVALLDESTATRVESNLIGTDKSGAMDLGNDLSGVFIAGSAGNTVGGATPDERNVIAGNGGNGVTLLGAGAQRNRIQGNVVGIAKDGATARANDHAGVGISDGASDNVIGFPTTESVADDGCTRACNLITPAPAPGSPSTAAARATRSVATACSTTAASGSISVVPA